MAKKQDVKIDDLVTVKPITDNQKVAFEAFKKDNKELNPKPHHFILNIDRSGSMMGKEDDTLGGINSTFELLKQEKDENTSIKVSVKLFDHEQTLLFRSIDLEEVRNITRDQYHPRGQTALLDAMGDTLSHFMEKKLMDPNAYDSCVIYVVTDGKENNSKNYSCGNNINDNFYDVAAVLLFFVSWFWATHPN